MGLRNLRTLTGCRCRIPIDPIEPAQISIISSVDNGKRKKPEYIGKNSFALDVRNSTDRNVKFRIFKFSRDSEARLFYIAHAQAKLLAKPFQLLPARRRHVFTNVGSSASSTWFPARASSPEHPLTMLLGKAFGRIELLFGSSFDSRPAFLLGF